jgi:hypothetical protein
MKFKEAEEAINKAFPKKYHSLEYGVTYHDDGDTVINCRVYVEELKSEEGRTWEEAVNRMLIKAGLEPLSDLPFVQPPPDEEE